MSPLSPECTRCTCKAAKLSYRTQWRCRVTAACKLSCRRATTWEAQPDGMRLLRPYGLNQVQMLNAEARLVMHCSVFLPGHLQLRL